MVLEFTTNSAEIMKCLNKLHKSFILLLQLDVCCVGFAENKMSIQIIINPFTVILLILIYNGTGMKVYCNDASCIRKIVVNLQKKILLKQSDLNDLDI